MLICSPHFKIQSLPTPKELKATCGKTNISFCAFWLYKCNHLFKYPLTQQTFLGIINWNWWGWLLQRFSTFVCMWYVKFQKRNAFPEGERENGKSKLTQKRSKLSSMVRPWKSSKVQRAPGYLGNCRGIRASLRCQSQNRPLLTTAEALVGAYVGHLHLLNLDRLNLDNYCIIKLWRNPRCSEFLEEFYLSHHG